MADSTIVFVVLAGVVVLFVSNVVPVEIVAVGTALTLWATDVLDLDQALAGFGDPTVVYIASLFVVSEALDATGVTAWAGQQLVARAGSSRAPAAGPDDAAVRRADRVDQRQRGRRRAAAGGRRHGRAAAAAAVAAADAAGLRRPRRVDAGADRHAGERHRLGGLQGRRRRLLRVLRVHARRRPAARRHDRDRRAARQAAAARAARRGTSPRTSATTPGRCCATTSSTDAVAGRAVQPPLRRRRGGHPATFGDRRRAGVPRHGHRQRRPRRARRAAPRARSSARETELAAGDTLLLQGTWDALSTHLDDDPTCSSSTRREDVRRQAVPFGPGAKRATVDPRRDGRPARHRRRAAGGGQPARRRRPGPDRVVTLEQSYRAISWTTVVLVAGMIPLSTAMSVSGAADKLADRLVDDRRRLRRLPAADRAVRADRRARPADQQHGDDPHRHPDRPRPPRPSSTCRRARC